MKCNSFALFKEVKIQDNFLDYLLVDKENKTNYCAVELQSLDTTGSYKWLFGKKTKPFCINWKTTKKTIISQLITKSMILKANRKPIVLVVQDSLFEYIGFCKQSFSKTKPIHVLVVKFNNQEITYDNLFSFDYDDLLRSLYAEQQCDLSERIDKLLS